MISSPEDEIEYFQFMEKRWCFFSIISIQRIEGCYFYTKKMRNIYLEVAIKREFSWNLNINI